MRFFRYLFFMLCTAYFMTLYCAADAVFRSDDIIDLSAIKFMFSDTAQFTVIKSPDPQQGSLFCRGAELSNYDSFAHSDADSLVFVPFCEDVFCQIELQPQSEDKSLSIVITNSDCSLSSYSIEAGQYCWAWAQNGYFSHIISLAEAALL